MALFNEMMETFCIMDTVTSNGAFGVVTTLTEGATFNAFANKKSDTASMVAAVEQKVGNYLITYDTTVTLEKNNIIKRKRDGAAFKIDTLSDATPDMASFAFQQANAYDYTIA